MYVSHHTPLTARHKVSTKMNSSRSIRIPLAGENNKGLFVEIFPDELPEDVNDVLDVLKAELAPLKIWKAVAVEYYRQGQSQHFEAVLNEIVSTIEQDKSQYWFLIFSSHF
jgi:flagellar biosynthesis regulator FlaF